MSDNFQGKLGFLVSNLGGGSAQVSFLGVVRSRAPAFPEIEVRRVIVDDGASNAAIEPLDVKRGQIQIEELNDGGGQATAKEGVVSLRLTGKAAIHADGVVWEFTVRALPASKVEKGKHLELVLRARIQSTDDFEEVSRVPLVGLSAKQLNTQDPAVLTLRANPVPRLSVGLNEATPPPPPKQYTARRTTLSAGPGRAENAASGAAADIAAALYTVFVRLDAPNTLDAVWDEQAGDRSIFNLSSRLLERDPIRVADEMWARQVTEMLAFTPYGGPQGTTGIGPESKFISEGLANSQPQYGVVFACQQLASFGLAARGVKFAGSSKSGELMINAGSVAARTFTSAPVNGRWFTFAGETPKEVVRPNGTPLQLQGNVPSSGKAFFDAGIGPGSIFVFANRTPRDDDAAFLKGAGCTVIQTSIGPMEYCQATSKAGKANTTSSRIRQNLLPDNTAGAHAAFVLRTDPRRKVFQTFDTGGLGVPNRGADVSLFPSSSGFHSGNFDDPAGTKINGADPFRGMGVLPALDASGARDLIARVNDVLKKARPLGFARFALIRRGALPSNKEFKSGNAHKLITDGRLVFASPLLRMYGDEPDQNYAISRYLWSLRDFPAKDTLEAWWFLYIPQQELAAAMLASARTDTPSEIAEACFFSVMTPDQQRRFRIPTTSPDQKASPDSAKILRTLAVPILDCVVDATGNAKVTFAMRSQDCLHALHALESQSSSKSPTSLSPLTAFPPTTGNIMPRYFAE